MPVKKTFGYERWSANSMAKILVKIQNIIFSIIKDTRSKGYPKDLLNVQCKEFKKTSPLYDPPQLKKIGEAQIFYEMGEEGLKLKKKLINYYNEGSKY